MPTLGFVVERYLSIRDFVKESFWYLKLSVKRKVDDVEIEIAFNWERDRFYAEEPVKVLHEMAEMESKGVAVVKTVTASKKTKRKPLPLTTVSMQKLATSKLRMSSDVVMKIAEKLYTSGFISYPRTETDVFDKTIDLKRLIANLTEFPEPTVRNFVDKMNTGEAFERPRAGGHNDNAHPPIHPVKPPHNLTEQEFKIYNLVARHFLACCAKDALGEGTKIIIQYGAEEFSVNGTVVIEKNYLEVYPYERWDDNTLPKFGKGEEFKPAEFSVKKGETVPPQLLTESDLIGLMEKNSIGTDSTIHEHIKTIQERKYAFKQGMSFKPSNLGVSLVECYQSLGLKIDLTKPHLRAEMEKDMALVAKGTLTKENVILKYQTLMGEIYSEVDQKKELFVSSLGKYIEENKNLNSERADPDDDNPGDNGDEGGPPGAPGGERSRVSDEKAIFQSVDKATMMRVCDCPHCETGKIVIKKKNAGGYFLACTGYPHCQAAGSLPLEIESADLTSTKCKSCSSSVKEIYKLKVTFHEKSNRPSQQCIMCSEKFTNYRFEVKIKTGNGPAPSPNLATQPYRPYNQDKASSMQAAYNNPSHRSNSVVQNPTRDMSHLTCYRCQQPGHISTNCPQPASASVSHALICNKCKEPGHLAHNCPKNGGGGNTTGYTKQDKNNVGGQTSNGGNRDKSNIECYNCKNKGHYSTECPNPRKKADK